MDNVGRGNGIAQIIYAIILATGIGCSRETAPDAVAKAAASVPGVRTVSVPGEGSGITYYVNPSGSDANPGTVAAPFATIQKAADLVNPGDVVVVQDGVYTRTAPVDNGVVQITRSGTSTAWVTFEAEHQGGAVIDGNANTTGDCLRADASYVLVEGFEIRNCAVTGVSVATATDVYFYKNHIHDIGRVDSCSSFGNSGGYIDRGTTRITFDSNLIHDIGRNHITTCSDPYVVFINDHGLYMYGSHNTIVSNVFYNCTSGFEFQLSGGSAATDGSGWYVANNTFGPGNNPNEIGAIAIWTESGGHNPSNVTIENNIAYNPDQGTFVYNLYSGDSSWTVRNNLIFNAGSTSASLFQNAQPAINAPSNVIGGVDPLFVNPVQFDFHLQSTSPALRAGNPTTIVTQDFDGNPVGPQPDLGAFQGPGTQESYGAMTIGGFNSSTEFYFDSHGPRGFIPVDFTASVISPAGTALSTGQMINVSGRVDSRGYMTASSVVVLTPASFSGEIIAGFNSASEFYFDSHGVHGVVPVDFTQSVVTPAGTTLATGQTVNVSGGMNSRGYMTASSVQVVSP